MRTSNFDAIWSSTVGVQPIAEALKYTFNKNWFRIYSLSSGQRYPESKDEENEVARRANQIISFFEPRDLLIITTDLGEPLKDSVYWKTIDEKEHEGVASREVYLAEIRWSYGSLDELMLDIAKDKMGGVIIAPPNCEWLVHPYDGGFDVIVFDNKKMQDIKMKLKNLAPRQEL